MRSASTPSEVQIAKIQMRHGLLIPEHRPGPIARQVRPGAIKSMIGTSGNHDCPARAPQRFLHAAASRTIANNGSARKRKID